MANQVEPPIITDTAGILQIGIEYLQSIYPGWVPNRASYDYREMAAHAAMISEFMQLAATVPPSIIRTLGTVFFQTPPFPAIAATGACTFSAVDNLGYTVKQGLNLALTRADGSLAAFQVREDIVIPPASTSTAVGGVPLIAADPGIEGNDLSGEIQLLDNEAWVSSVTLVGKTANGQDAETENAYAVRVSQLSPLIALRVIRPEDFALAARLLFPGVARALPIDNYNPETEETEVARCMTVASIDALGQPISSEEKEEMRARLSALREETFQLFVIDPTYTTINVAFTGVSQPGYEPSDVKVRAIEAVKTALSPAECGVPATGDRTSWVAQTVVRYQDIVTVLNNVEGFDHYIALTLNGGTADVALAGHAALSQPGTITGTVS
jgi:hypothetical protein